MKPEKITRVVDQGLDGICFSLSDQQAVFNKIHAPASFSFKLKPALILAILLVLTLASFAVAHTLKILEAATQITQTERQTAFLVSWNDDDKLQFVRMMRENGIEFPEGDGAIHRESWWTPYNALGDAMGQAFGDTRFLTIQQQLFCQQVYADCGIVQKGDPMVIPPLEDGITQEEAFAKVKQEMQATRGLSGEALDGYLVSVGHTTVNLSQELCWLFSFYGSASDLEPEYLGRLSETTGKITIEHRDDLPPEGTGSIAVINPEMPQTDWTLSPKTGDITQEEAESIARKTIGDNYPLSKEYIDDLVFSQASYYGRNREPVWGIKLTELTNDGHDKYFYITVHAETGEVVDVWDPNMGWG